MYSSILGFNPFLMEQETTVTNRVAGWYVLNVQGQNTEQIAGPFQEKPEALKALNDARKDRTKRGLSVKYWDGTQWVNTNLQTQSYQWNEERTLSDNVAALIERATGICMETWFSLTKTFYSQADKYDPEPVEPSEKFMNFRLAPGIDAREDVYKKIIDASEQLCDKLNDALGRNMFTNEIVRKDGKLEVTARYAEGKGGIFKVVTKETDIGRGIKMAMPRQGVIRNAFKALLTTPEFPIVDDIPDAERVIPDRPKVDDENIDAVVKKNGEGGKEMPKSFSDANQKQRQQLGMESYIFEKKKDVDDPRQFEFEKDVYATGPRAPNSVRKKKKDVDDPRQFEFEKDDYDDERRGVPRKKPTSEELAPNSVGSGGIDFAPDAKSVRRQKKRRSKKNTVVDARVPTTRMGYGSRYRHGSTAMDNEETIPGFSMASGPFGIIK